MIVMTPEATRGRDRAVVTRLETTGVHVVVLPGELTTAIGAIGDPEGVRELGLEGMAGVDRVVPISRPYKLASLRAQPTTSRRVFDIDGRRSAAATTFCLIAGPCTVESREQTLEVARAVEPAGASMLRGGAFKPRTSPFAFKGLGRAGAGDPRRGARARPGLPVVTEVIDAPARRRGRRARRRDPDRRAQHAELRAARGRGQARQAGAAQARAVLHVDELLHGRRLHPQGGQRDVILCERGIRTFETATRFTLDLGAIPWLKLHTHLPVIVDPSHAAGRPPARRAAARAAAAVGADGIIVEVPPRPRARAVRRPQALHARDFAGFASASPRTPGSPAVASPERSWHRRAEPDCRCGAVPTGAWRPARAIPAAPMRRSRVQAPALRLAALALLTTAGAHRARLRGRARTRQISIADASLTSDAGTSTLSFAVTLSAVSDQPVTVEYTTAAGSAQAGDDFEGGSGTVTFGPATRPSRSA